MKKIILLLAVILAAGFCAYGIEISLDQAAGVLAEHLVETLCPAEALVPRIAERDGLLVVERRLQPAFCPWPSPGRGVPDSDFLRGGQ